MGQRGGRGGKRVGGGAVHFPHEFGLGFGTEVAVDGGLDLEEGLDDGFEALCCPSE